MQLDDQLRATVSDVIEAAGAGQFCEQIFASLEPAIRLLGDADVDEQWYTDNRASRRSDDPNAWPAKDAHRAMFQRRLMSLPLGGSRIGGVPDLPSECEWPQHEGSLLPFIAQVNLADVPAWEGRPLPVAGWLWFFVHYTAEGRLIPKVLHIAYGCPLRRHETPPADALAEATEYNVVYQLIAVAPQLAWDLNGDTFQRLCGRPPADGDLPSEVQEVRGRLPGLVRSPDYSTTKAEPLAQLLGGVPWYCETANSLAASKWNGGRTEGDWINLLQVGSVGDMQWSDCGDLNFLIRRPALAAGDFTEILAAVCSS